MKIRNIVMLSMLATHSVGVFAGEQAQYLFDRYDLVRQTNTVRTFERVGGCRFGFFAPGSDNRLLVDVVTSDEFIRLNGEPFNFSIPKSDVLPDSWSDSGSNFLNLGSDRILIGSTTVDVNVLIKSGSSGDQVVIYLHKVSGVLGFRFGLTGVEYRAESIPSRSILDCLSAQ